MKYSSKFSGFLPTLIIGISIAQFGGADAFAASIATQAPISDAVSASRALSQFKPRPSSRKTFDYSVWDEIIESMVLYTGPSTRRKSSRPRPTTGTRFVHAHTSPYRMEGNKIPFSKFEKKFENIVREYRLDLEALGTQIDIPSLSRDEQLAYWLNLHNVVIIEQLAANYPVQVPSRMRIGPDKHNLHNAKIIQIDGVSISLRDIRERIIYPNWKNPIVIYGFFLGDIGSPTIQNYAYTGKNVYRILGLGAVEFTNSLRGFEEGKVSQLYSDLRPFYFPDFETDLRAHLNKYMRPAVQQELASASVLKVARYETTIADLTGGYGNRQSISPLRVNGLSTLGGRGGAFETYVRDVYRKREILEEQGLNLRGTVTIEDILPEDAETYDTDINTENPE